MLLSRSFFELSSDRRSEPLRRLRELIAEFEDDTGERRLGLLVAAYPLDDLRGA